MTASGDDDPRGDLPPEPARAVNVRCCFSAGLLLKPGGATGTVGRVSVCEWLR
jgi:hypothetical protein